MDQMWADWNAEEITDTTENYYIIMHRKQINKRKKKNKAFIIVGMKRHYNSSMMTLK